MRNLPSLTTGLIRTGLVKGTGLSYTTTVASAGMINGAYVTALGVQTNAAIPTTDAVSGLVFPSLAVNKATVIVLGQNAAGAVRLCQGSIVDTEVGVTTTAGAFRSAPQFPQLPDDFMVLGWALIRTAPSAASFTLGVSAWAATGVTTSEFVQGGTLPDRPVTA